LVYSCRGRPAASIGPKSSKVQSSAGTKIQPVPSQMPDESIIINRRKYNKKISSTIISDIFIE
jgi:hypothetical protein